MTSPIDAGHTCVFGLSWGDEGKGKIIDLLCPAFDVVVRFNGGANAGHTVCVGPLKYALHLLPSGVLHENAVGVIGPGVVVDPLTLIEEIDALAKRGVNVLEKLKLSDRAHLVLPHHRLEDRLSEDAASEGTKIGTTARGIGPCYADKMRRSTALRVADLMDSAFEDHLRRVVSARAGLLKAVYGEAVEIRVDSVVNELRPARERLRGAVCDTTEYLHGAMESGRRILFEGANGMLLDVDHGTYPFVTSSSTGPHGIGAGAGVPASRVTRLIGVTKSYATRVGAGPFVSELKNEVGDRIRQRGNEYGTTTGRPRRCGWFDAVSARYAARLSGATDIALMHLDTLSGFEKIGVCTAYRVGGRTIQTPPANARLLDQAEAVIEMLPGWTDDLRGVRRYSDLPKPARAYVERVESLVGAPVSLIGVGPERSQTLVRERLSDLVSLPEVSAV
jgi:adenylosuccinate synthase